MSVIGIIVMVLTTDYRLRSYIRDLIAGLADSENYDRHMLALSTAPSLIRRKADFGSELKDRTMELASCIVSLHDNFEIDDWHDLRLQAMLALVVAQPRILGPYLATMLFNGDYSISQRALILTAIGLGCRELAGFEQDSKSLSKVRNAESRPFPTQKLSRRLHGIYSSDSQLVDTVARQLEQNMLRPLSTKQRQRTVVLKNDLASLVADSFFFPLTGSWQAFAQTRYVC